MWLATTQPKYERNGMRYASDPTAEELALIETRLPPGNERGRRLEWL